MATPTSKVEDLVVRTVGLCCTNDRFVQLVEEGLSRKGFKGNILVGKLIKTRNYPIATL